MSFDDAERSRDSSSPRELYLFTQGAREWAYTGADADIVYSGRTYVKATIGRTQIDQSQEENAGGLEVKLPASNAVAQLGIGFQPTEPIFLTIIRVHRSWGAAVQFVGRVNSWSYDGPEATLDCSPLTGVLTRQIPTLGYQRQCNWPLYSPGCGVLRESFRDAAVVSFLEGLLLRSPTFAGRANGWYAAGYVELVTGERAGDRRYVVAHSGTDLTLSAPFSGITVGDTVHAFAGCDRTEATCTGKFANLIHHLGFSHIPTTNPYKGRMS